MSSRIRSKNKQKRSSRRYQIVFSPIALPEDFPLAADLSSAQGDDPITWLHCHDCLELGYCYEGAGLFVIGEKVLPFETGAVSVITPSEFHLARSMAGTKSKWAWIYFDPVRPLDSSPRKVEAWRLDRLSGKAFRNITTPQNAPAISALARQLIDELEARQSGYRTAVRGLIMALMIQFNRRAPKRAKTTSTGPNLAIQRIAPALDLMASRYRDALTIQDWADCCHVSAPHFRRLFLHALGQSPYQYLTELRILMGATRLRSTRDKIVVIAGEVGFPTLSSFNRAFRQIMQTTPRHWRTYR